MTPDILPTLAFHAVLLLARIGGALMLLPGLGEPDVPMTVRLAIVLAVVALLLPPLTPLLPGPPDAPPEAIRLLLIESVIGIWLGLLARLVAMALAQAGQVVALMIGLVSPLQTDPMLGAAGTATSRLFGLLAAVLVLSGGLYALPLRALADSYAALPPGGDLPAGPVAATLARAVADSLALALRLAAPLVLAALLGNLGLALLSRLAPQVQVYFVAVPAQLLLGLLLLALLLPAVLGTWTDAARTLLRLPVTD